MINIDRAYLSSIKLFICFCHGLMQLPHPRKQDQKTRLQQQKIAWSSQNTAEIQAISQREQSSQELTLFCHFICVVVFSYQFFSFVSFYLSSMSVSYPSQWVALRSIWCHVVFGRLQCMLSCFIYTFWFLLNNYGLSILKKIFDYI